MKTNLKKFLCVSVSLWFVLLMSGCQKEPQNRVVLYCSVDDVYARPIIADLELKTGLQIEALYDVEAAKTAGLANKIRAEKNRPRGDVFWSSALLQTLLLEREGLLEKYWTPTAKDVPAAFKSENGNWTGMGVRSRVVMYSHKPSAGSSAPNESILLSKQRKNKIGISNPQFGTASDWAAALSVRYGREKTLNYFRALKKNGVRVLPGNGVVAEKVARGELMAGVTDSDDYLVFAKKFRAQEKRKISAIGFNVGDGGVLIPGSVAILKDAPNLENAKKLANALVSIEGENLLVKNMPGVKATRDFDKPGNNVSIKSPALFPVWPVPNDSDKWASAWLSIRDPLFEILLAP